MDSCPRAAGQLRISSSCPPAFAQQSAFSNGSRITSKGSMTLLKVCIVFFRVRRSDWDISRSFLRPFRGFFLKHLNNESAPLRYVEKAAGHLLNAME